MTLRTVARDTKSVRPNPLTARPCSKEARRISPILSTPIIPISPSQPTEAKGKDADTQRQRGSLLDAKIAPQGVIIASEFTTALSHPASLQSMHKATAPIDAFSRWG